MSQDPNNPYGSYPNNAGHPSNSYTLDPNHPYPASGSGTVPLADYYSQQSPLPNLHAPFQSATQGWPGGQPGYQSPAQNPSGTSTQPTNLSAIQPLADRTYVTDPSNAMAPQVLSARPGPPILIPPAYHEFLRMMESRPSRKAPQNTVVNLLPSASQMQSSSLVPTQLRNATTTPIQGTAQRSQAQPATSTSAASIVINRYDPFQMDSRVITQDGQPRMYHLYSNKRPGSIICSHPAHAPGDLHWMGKGEGMVTSTDRTCRYSTNCWAGYVPEPDGSFSWKHRDTAWTKEEVQALIDGNSNCQGMTVGVVGSIPTPKSCRISGHNSYQIHALRRTGWFWIADDDDKGDTVMCPKDMLTKSGLGDPTWLGWARDIKTGRMMSEESQS